MLDEKEVEKLNMLRERLRGVPPPPTITNPRISMDEALPRLRDYFSSPSSTESVQSKNESEFPATFDVYQNNHPVCETLDMLYEKIRKRCVTHETISFIGSPPPPPPPPPSPLQTCDFVDLLPRSLSSPASPAPDLLSLELVQRRNRSNAGRRTKPAVPKMTIRKPNPRLLDALVSQASVPKVVRSDLQMSSKLHSKMISVPKKEVPAPATSAVTATTSTVPETKTHEQLSVIHRKKLLWATSQAIKSTFPELSSDSGTLKRNVSALFRLCLTQWLLVRNDAHDAGKGTSERMLELATRLAPNVVNSL